MRCRRRQYENITRLWRRRVGRSGIKGGVIKAKFARSSLSASCAGAAACRTFSHASIDNQLKIIVYVSISVNETSRKASAVAAGVRPGIMRVIFLASRSLCEEAITGPK